MYLYLDYAICILFPHTRNISLVKRIVSLSASLE